MGQYEPNPFYARFDRAVEHLPGHLRVHAHVRCSNEDPQTGVVSICSEDGRFLGRVDLYGNVELAPPPYSLKAAAEERAAKAAQEAKRSEDAAVAGRVRQSEDAILKACARFIDQRFATLDKLLEEMRLKAAAINTTLTEKALDLEVYDSVRELAEKVDNLSITVSDLKVKGFNYRGYWRPGTVAKRGDAFTDSGICWYCHRDTETKPNRADQDTWSILVNKGRDGK
jgi:hypothetical protein